MQILTCSIRLLPQAKNVHTATKAGLHTQLARLLHDNGSNVTVRNKRQAAECFSLISRQSVGRTALCDSMDTLNAIKTLSSDDDTIVRQFSMQTMSELATLQIGADTLTESELIEHYAERAKLEKDPLTKQLALHIIHSCCRQNKEEACRQAFAAGVVETTVGILKNHSSQDEEVLFQAVKLLRVLGERFDQKVEVINQDAVLVLLDALKHGTMSLRTRGNVCGALTLLCTEKEGKVQVIEYGMDLFVSTLHDACKEPKGPQILEVILSTMQLLATMSSYPPARQQCIDRRVLDIVSTVERTYPDQPHIMRAVEVCRRSLMSE